MSIVLISLFFTCVKETKSLLGLIAFIVMTWKIECGISDVAVQVSKASEVAGLQGTSITGIAHQPMNLPQVFSSMGCIAPIAISMSKLEFHLVYIK